MAGAPQPLEVPAAARLLIGQAARRGLGSVGPAADCSRRVAVSPGFPRQCCPQGGGEPACHLLQRRLRLEGDPQRVRGRRPAHSPGQPAHTQWGLRDANALTCRTSVKEAAVPTQYPVAQSPTPFHGAPAAWPQFPSQWNGCSPCHGVSVGGMCCLKAAAACAAGAGNQLLLVGLLCCVSRRTRSYSGLC